MSRAYELSIAVVNSFNKEENVIFGGRLGEYKYYDMDAVIASVLEKCEEELK